jgi:hypothetical protein
VSLGFVGEVFEVRTQVDHDLTSVSRFDRPLGLTKNLGHHNFYSGDNELRLGHLTSVRQMHDELITSYIRRFRETKNCCYNLVISERDLAELAFNSLRSHIREKLEGHEFVDVAQVLVRALDHESRSKDTRLKSDHPYMHMLDYES